MEVAAIGGQMSTSEANIYCDPASTPPLGEGWVGLGTMIEPI